MSFPRYPAYKDSGVEWLGEVPEHWKLVPIKRILQSIEQGWSPQCEAAPAEPGEWGVLKVGCVNGGKFNPDENKALPRELLADERLGIRSGDVLVSRANTRELVGSVAMAERDYPNILLCDKLYRLRTDQPACSPAFLARYLASDGARNVIETSASGASSSMLNIGQSVIINMPITLPSASEQADLIHFLDRETAKIDALIAEQQRLIELLQEKRQAVISHAVTKGLNPDAPMKDSGVEWLGEVPEQWPIKPIKYLASKASGGTPAKDNLSYWKDGDVPWASSKDLKTDKIGDTQDHLTQVAISEGAAQLQPVGSVFICVRGMILAHTFPVTEPLRKMAINQDLKCLVPTKEISSGYLALCLRGLSGDILRRVDEAAHGTKVLRIPDFDSVLLPVPPLVEQQQILSAIAHSLGHLDSLVSQAARAMELLSERRSALISAAVTGQIDVRGLVPEVSVI